MFFTTGTNPKLAKNLAEKTGLLLGRAQLGRFTDGEVKFTLEEPVTDQQVFVMGSTHPPAENLLELLTILNTVKINGAKQIIAVIPYFGYAKSDRPDRPNVPINARLFAKFIKAAGADKIIAVNLHSQYVQDYFRPNLVHLSAGHLLVRAVKVWQLSNVVVAAPDMGGKKRAEEFSLALLGHDKICLIEKFRPTADKATVRKIHDGVAGKNVIIVDDMVQTGGTLISAGDALKGQGAEEIYIALTHFVFSGGAIKKLASLPDVKKVVFTDTIPMPADVHLPGKFEIISVVDLLCQAVREVI